MLFSGGKLVAAIFLSLREFSQSCEGRDIRGRFLKKFEVLGELGLAVSEEKDGRERTLVSGAAKLGQRARKARPLCDLCHSRPVSGNLFRLRTLVTFTGPCHYL